MLRPAGRPGACFRPSVRENLRRDLGKNLGGGDCSKAEQQVAVTEKEREVVRGEG